MDEGLVDARIADLSARDGRVEPAQLQIVCDTLWGDGSHSRLTLADYRALGQDDSNATIVAQVLNRRLEQQFRVFETRDELAVLEALPRARDRAGAAPAGGPSSSWSTPPLASEHLTFRNGDDADFEAELAFEHRVPDYARRALPGRGNSLMSGR